MKFLNTDFLFDDKIILKVEKLTEENPEKKWVPAYLFEIFDKNGNKVGICDLRIGHSEGLYYGGNIGYEIYEEYRGHHYSARACELLFKLAKLHELEYLYITCNPENIASKKICEFLQGEFVGLVALPMDNEMRNDGDTHKLVYKFILE